MLACPGRTMQVNARMENGLGRSTDAGAASRRRRPAAVIPDTRYHLFSKGAEYAALASHSAVVPVRHVAKQWRPVGDSNPCYRRERAVS